MEEYFTILSNFGFPVAVASYLLFRFEKKLENLETTNTRLVTEIAILKQKVIELQKIITRVHKKIKK
jgi:hypothetical protein